MQDLEALFSQMGGTFVKEMPIAKHLPEIQGFLFDWDGVFNGGRKSEVASSDFSESVSMGVNMLRFSYYLKYGRQPLMIIVTGQKNPGAIRLASREHFDALFMNIKDKKTTLPTLETTFNLTPEHAGFFFDDILDLSLAERVRIPILIKNFAAPMLQEYVIKNKLAGYVTANDGEKNGLREACELLIGMNGNFDDTVSHRVAFSDDYQQYLAERNKIETLFLSSSDGGIKPFTP